MAVSAKRPICAENLLGREVAAEDVAQAFLAKALALKTCAYRKSSPSILVMQSTQDRTAQNAPRYLGGM